MLRLVTSYFVGGIFLVSISQAAEVLPMPIAMSDVVQKVSTENYSVYANALRVYQAREGIKATRGNLLPRLNVWKLGTVVVDPLNAVSLIEDLAPFLVPANWFRYSEAKLLYQAEKEGYRALWANELMTAKALYTHLLLDQSLLEHIREGQKELQDLLVIVQARETLGGVPQGASRDIENRLLALKEDQRSLEVVIAEEESLLAFMMGLPAGTALAPLPIEMPDFEHVEPLRYGDFEYRALDVSPEVRQFGYFIRAADYVKQETVYSFLGSPSMSRGIGGGVFDGLPSQDGLGFGTPATFRIAKAQKEILKVQSSALKETVRRQLKLLIQNYNLDLENYVNLKRRVEISKETSDQLYERLTLGQDVDVLQLIEASRNHIQADTALFAVKFRFLTNEDKLSRLIFYGDYSKPPVEIEELQERDRKGT